MCVCVLGGVGVYVYVCKWWVCLCVCVGWVVGCDCVCACRCLYYSTVLLLQLVLFQLLADDFRLLPKITTGTVPIPS